MGHVLCHDMTQIIPGVTKDARFREEMTPEFLEAHGLTDLMKVVRGVPPLHCPYVPQNSLVREFVGGSCYEY